MTSTILFLCTGNSARSIMAEAIVKQKYGNEIIAFSAGSKPKGEVHPLTIQTLENQGLATGGLESKSWNVHLDRVFDLVVTVCDSAREEACPDFPGDPPKIHWHLPDPPAAEFPEEMFIAVYDALEEAIGLLLYAPDPSLVGRAREAARQISRRFTPRAV